MHSKYCLHTGHQQVFGQCPNRTHPGLVPPPFHDFHPCYYLMNQPSSNHRHHRCFDLRRSKTLEVRLAACIIEKCIKNSSSTGLIVIRELRRRFWLLPWLMLSDKFSYNETILLRQVAPVHHHFVTFVHLVTSVCVVRQLFSFLAWFDIGSLPKYRWFQNIAYVKKVWEKTKIYKP